MIQKLGFFLCLFAWGNVWADGEVQTFRYLIKIPQSSHSCQEEAVELGRRFQTSTKIQPDSVFCKGVVTLSADNRKYTLYSLVLTYRADQKPVLYSANYAMSDSSGIPNDSFGLYETYSGCLKQLEFQSRVFQEQTGLLAVASTCQPGSYEFKRSYVLHIDGFGLPKNRLHGQELKFMGVPSQEVKKQVDQMIELLGISLVSYSANHILYYAPLTFSLNHDYVATFYSKDQCDVQLATVRTMFAKFGTPDAVVACLPLGVGNAYYLEAVREGNYFLRGDNGTAFPRYYSFEECMTDAGSANSNNNDVGGICHTANSTGSEFELELFSRL